MAQTSKVALRVNALELTTEERNVRSMNLDELNPREILELIGSEDEIAIAEARRLAPKTALLVDVTVRPFRLVVQSTTSVPAPRGGSLPRMQRSFTQPSTPTPESFAPTSPEARERC